MTDFNEDLFYTTNLSPMTSVSIHKFMFPGGEVGININTQKIDYNVANVKLSVRAKNSDNLMAAFMATDALRRVFPNARIHLYIPYIPYARQDRVCNAGEALSIKVVAQLINSQDYATVRVVDPHSPTSVALIDRVIIQEQYDVFRDLKTNWAEWILIAPDMGALKKVEDFAKRVNAKGVIAFNKTRELATGKITGMKCMDDIDPNGKFMVLDDICDGGRTFIELAQHIPLCTQKLELAVTHGIFSKGVECVTKMYSKVHTTNSFHGGLLPQAGLNIIKV